MASAMNGQRLIPCGMRPKVLKVLVMAFGAAAVTCTFGQVANYTWTGAADGTNLDTPGNYTTKGVAPATTLPNGLDFSGIQESVIWDGRTSTALILGQGNTVF